MTTGRNFDEILRVIDSMQLTAKHKVATPADWKQGGDVIITGAVSNEEADRRCSPATRRTSRICGRRRSRSSPQAIHLRLRHAAPARGEMPKVDLASEGTTGCYFQGVTAGTLSVGAGASTVPKSAGETISRYSMSGE